ncbi:hypothetical protein KIN20_025228 [Parelaphostrongylus tenuis]|uniref:Uncharacterized protein n=1 Tax=Parelaphostrongylus tenuis TaxID=148309 RepID=A0AAD5QWI6_PARTN|nr:hypothetical protein KIN20_025228 [Parelaphostrongylus tenuis]
MPREIPPLQSSSISQICGHTPVENVQAAAVQPEAESSPWRHQRTSGLERKYMPYILEEDQGEQ